MNFDFGNGLVPMHQHPNGGGLVADTAEVAETVFVGPYALVYENAVVYGYARISGHAEVYGFATVSGFAVVHGDACISGNAQVYGYSQVYGEAQVYGNAKVYGYVHVYGETCVSGDFNKEMCVDINFQNHGETTMGISFEVCQMTNSFLSRLMFGERVVCNLGSFDTKAEAIVIGKSKAKEYLESLIAGLSSSGKYRVIKKNIDARQWFPGVDKENIVFMRKQHHYNGMPINSGDWIVEYPDKIVIVSDEEFQNTFEEVL